MLDNFIVTGVLNMDGQGFYWEIIWIALILLAIVQAAKMIYRTHIHPLRSVPGPWISSVTSA